MKILKSAYYRALNEAVSNYPIISTSKPGKTVGEIGASRSGKLYRWNGRNWSKYSGNIGNVGTTILADPKKVTTNQQYPTKSTSLPGTTVGEIIQSRTGKLYRWNGKSWSAVGRTSNTSTRTSSVQTPVTKHNTPVTTNKFEKATLKYIKDELKRKFYDKKGLTSKGVYMFNAYTLEYDILGNNNGIEDEMEDILKRIIPTVKTLPKVYNAYYDNREGSLIVIMNPCKEFNKVNEALRKCGVTMNNDLYSSYNITITASLNIDSIYDQYVFGKRDSYDIEDMKYGSHSSKICLSILDFLKKNHAARKDRIASMEFTTGMYRDEHAYYAENEWNGHNLRNAVIKITTPKGKVIAEKQFGFQTINHELIRQRQSAGQSYAFEYDDYDYDDDY
jgi:hypothetical protein